MSMSSHVNSLSIIYEFINLNNIHKWQNNTLKKNENNVT